MAPQRQLEQAQEQEQGQEQVRQSGETWRPKRAEDDEQAAFEVQDSNLQEREQEREQKRPQCLRP